MIDLEEYIDGSKFESIADFGYGDKYTTQHDLDIDKLLHFLSTFNQNRLPIVYVDSDRVLEFFKKVKEIKCPNFILLSHNGDTIFGENEVYEKPNFIVKWFGQNINVINTNTIISLPIGLERPHWSLSRYGDFAFKHKKIYQYSNLIFEKNSLCYINFNIETNRMKRSWIVDYFSNEVWCKTRIGGINGSLDNYFTDCKSSYFVLCPDGNGIDCHRNWEMLYLGSIPIVEKSNFHSEIYSNLPVIIVDSFKQINQKYLLQMINTTPIINYEKLKFSYWEKLIKNRT